MDESTRSFKEKLEKAYVWPALYTFKFIMPQDKVGKVKAIFPAHQAKEKVSSKGKYVSLTISLMAKSSDEIIDYYQKVHLLGDVIAL